MFQSIKLGVDLPSKLFEKKNNLAMMITYCLVWGRMATGRVDEQTEIKQETIEWEAKAKASCAEAD